MPDALYYKPITAEEFEKFDPEWRYELVKGRLVELPPPPGSLHGAITCEMSYYAGQFVRDKGLGKCYAAGTGFIVERNPDSVIAPDWAFVAKERLLGKRTIGFLPVVPDAVLETWNFGDITRWMQKRVQFWIETGVRLVWELNPKKKIMTVYRPGQEAVKLGIKDVISGEDVLAGFELPVKALFPDE